MIEAKEVTVHLSGRPVLNSVSCSVAPGELIGVIGPNGAGKTTLLRALAGLVPTHDGTIRIAGRDIRRMDRSTVSRRIAVVPQSTALSFAFSVRDVVAMGRTPHRGRLTPDDPAGDAIVDRALERTAIEHLAERRVTELSGGERRRVLIAQALAQETPGLALDEPTASLDIGNRIETMELITDLVTDGVAALAAIHDLELAARYCERLLLLGDGQLIASGTPEEVLRPDRIERAFGTSVAVGNDPITGSRRVVPLPPRTSNSTRIVVLGRGRTAGDIVRRLHGDGYEPTLGITRDRDLANVVSGALDVDTITAPSTGPLPAETVDRARRRIATADVVVLSDAVVGDGRFPLLELAERAERLLIVEQRPSAERGHLHGSAMEQYRRLRHRGEVVDLEQLPARIEAMDLEIVQSVDREV